MEGHYNTFYGVGAGGFMTFFADHGADTFIGAGAGYHNATGHNNTFLGNYAGYANTTGYSNTFLGPDAGISNTTGSANVFLGYQAGYSETGSNKLYIDNSNTATPLIYGEFDNKILAINGKVGIGTKTPANPLQMAGGAYTDGLQWYPASSREYKDDIEALSREEAFDTLEGFNPVKFAYKADRSKQHVGFIAEEAPELVATKDRKGLSAMDIVAVLTKVVQQQHKMVKELKTENEGLKAKNESLENRLLVIEATIKALK